jgi:class 3 adenylate cyclase
MQHALAREALMPLYMDIHTIDPDTKWEDLAGAHKMDVELQGGYDVDYLKYWFNKERGKLFCLCEAPSAEAAVCVHRDAHGLLAEKLIEVDPDLLDSFMGDGAANAGGAALLPGASSETDRDTGVRAVMFTDIVNSTMTTSSLGDEGAMTMLRLHNRIVRKALSDNRGREVKHTGDGIMAAFLSAVGAVRCACQIQADVAAANDDTAPPLTLRVGISAGEPVEEGDDLFGSTVQLAARLCSCAAPGQVLVSNVVSDLCLGKGLSFADAGSRELKGFEAPVHTHAVQINC